MKSHIFTIILVLFVPLFSIAGDYQWITNGNGIFQDPANWLPSGVPGENDNSFFDSTSGTVFFEGDAVNQRLHIDNADVIYNLGGYYYSAKYNSPGNSSVVIGESGTASLEVQNGTVITSDTIIGKESGNGKLIVSNWANYASQDENGWHGLFIGQNGISDVNVISGGQLSHGHGESAAWANGVSHIQVDGDGSYWYVDGWFGMSMGGKTFMNVTNGGDVRMNVCQMAVNPGTYVNASVRGILQSSGFRCEAASEKSLVVGLKGYASLNIDDAVLVSAGNCILAKEAGSYGSLTIQNGSYFESWQAMAIGGDINKPGGQAVFNVSGSSVRLSTMAADSNSIIWPNGTINFGGGEIVLEYGPWTANTFEINGAFNGYGAVWAHMKNYGSVYPGGSYKLLECGYNYTQKPQGRLIIEMSGNEMATQYSCLQVTNGMPGLGIAKLDGVLEVKFINGYRPASYEQFTIVTAQQVIGKFINADTKYIFEDGSFDVTYNSDSVVLSNYSTEPACISRPKSDFNYDCYVDFADFAIFASEWLECGLYPQSYCP